MHGASLNIVADFDLYVQGCVGYASPRILVGVDVSCAESLDVVL